MKFILITIAAVVLVIQLVFGLATCFYKVDRCEHAVVFRLGKYTGSPVTEQGIHFKLPFGIDKHTLVDVTTPYMIVSDDPNNSDVKWSTEYSISDAYNYIKVQNGFELFIAMYESVLSEVLRDRKINEESPSKVVQMQQEMKSKLQFLADKHELGIKLKHIIITR